MYFGGPGCVTKCDMGGLKLANNSVTYFMDGPYDLDCKDLKLKSKF